MHARSRVFHVKRKSAWISSSTCYWAGRKRRTSWRLQRFPNCGPAISLNSLQLLALAPEARLWVDFGSGGGFPGIPIACALAGHAGAQVHLIESNGKKAAFLREAVRATGAPAVVHQERAEKFGESCAETVHAVTARALAPLKILCDQAFPLINRGAIGLFLKGQDVDAELTDAAKYWRLEASKVPSKTSPQSAIVIVRGLRPL